MLIGISMVIGAVCRFYLTLTPFVRITFENMPIILAGVMFGPLCGVAVGVASDLISSLLTGQNINLIITAGAGCVGLFAGSVSYFTNRLMIKIPRNVVITLSCIAAHFMGCVVVKTVGLYWYYYIGTVPFLYLFAIRFGLYFAICVIEILFISLILKNNNIRKFAVYEL